MTNLYYTLKVILNSVLILNSLLVYAQNKKPSSRVSPTHIKVDGELSEWNNKLPNFNRSTDIFYAISNDDKNLYLSVQAIDPLAIKKIIANGLSFSLFGSKKDEKAIITFPLLQNNTGSIFNILQIKTDAPDVGNHINKIDSLAKEMNKQITERAKEIMVIGINSINDTLISIYNEYNIKAALRFANKGVLNYELSLPITYINSKINAEREINYNVQLNGYSNSKIEMSPDGKFMVISSYQGNRQRRAIIDTTPEMIEQIPVSVSTDFNGKYTLTKGP